MKQLLGTIFFVQFLILNDVCHAQKFVVVKLCESLHKPAEEKPQSDSDKASQPGGIRIEANPGNGDGPAESKVEIPIQLPVDTKVFRIDGADILTVRVLTGNHADEILYLDKGCLKSEAELVNVSGEKKMPPPAYTVSDGSGRPIDPTKGISSTFMHSLVVDAGAGYQIRSMEVTLGHGSTRIGSITVPSGNADLSQWMSSVRPGDRLLITIKKVVRMREQGREQEVIVTGGIIKFVLN